MKISPLIDRDFFYLDAGDTVSYAAGKFAEKNFTSAPVLKKGRLLGVFTIYDVAAALAKAGKAGGKRKKAGTGAAGGMRVGEFLVQKAFYVPEDAEMDDAISIMADQRSSCIPVADKKGMLTGVLWAKDVRNAMAGMLSGKGGKDDDNDPDKWENPAPIASPTEPLKEVVPVKTGTPAAKTPWAVLPKIPALDLAMGPAGKQKAERAAQAGKPKGQEGKKTIAQLFGFGKKKNPEESELRGPDSGDNTAIDQVLNFVEKKGIVSSVDVAKEFKLPLSEIEAYAVSLEKHGLLQIEYTILGKMKLKKKE